MSLTEQRADQLTTLARDAGFSDEEILQYRDSKPKQTRVNRSNFPTEILDLLKTLGTITREQVQDLPTCPKPGANQRKTIGRAMTKVGEELVKSGHDGLEQPPRTHGGSPVGKPKTMNWGRRQRNSCKKKEEWTYWSHPSRARITTKPASTCWQKGTKKEHTVNLRGMTYERRKRRNGCV